MNKIYGKVIEVFIPEENKDIMLSNKIGFKVLLNNTSEIITIIEKQDEENAQILKGDLVLITKQIINNKEYIDIELCGEFNE